MFWPIVLIVVSLIGFVCIVAVLVKDWLTNRKEE